MRAFHAKDFHARNYRWFGFASSGASHVVTHRKGDHPCRTIPRPPRLCAPGRRRLGGIHDRGRRFPGAPPLESVAAAGHAFRATAVVRACAGILPPKRPIMWLTAPGYTAEACFSRLRKKGLVEPGSI